MRGGEKIAYEETSREEAGRKETSCKEKVVPSK
jgi:hypothetical protein